MWAVGNESMLRVLIAIVVLSWIGTIAVPTSVAQDSPASPREIQARVQELIRRLGADSFVERESAQQQLTDLGLNAFDALADAQDDPDLEIAERARYILSRLRVSWANEEENEAVRRLLKDFDARTTEERFERLRQLARFAAAESAMALTRIVRFDEEARVSLAAAIAVLNQKVDDDQRATIAAKLDQAVGASQREGAKWLRAYAALLRGDASAIQTWDELIARRIEADKNVARPDRIGFTIALAKWRAVQWAEAAPQQAGAALEQLAELLRKPGAPKLEPVVLELLDARTPQHVTSLAKLFRNDFESDLQLAYLRAEALRASGQVKAAEQLAESLVQRDTEDHRRHVRAGELLVRRGSHEWAEREFRSVIAARKNTDALSINAAVQLLELYHDAGRDEEAAEIAERLVKLAESTPVVGEQLLTNNYSLDRLQAELSLFRAIHFGQTGDVAKQREALLAGMEFGKDTPEVDLLIAQYRFCQDHPEEASEMRDVVQKRLDKSITLYQSAIENYRTALRRSSGSPAQRADSEARLATYNNQLAWLVSNTTGDLDQALAAIQESLLLRPETPGYLDTLGRCRYARGEFELAVQAQRRACELDPGARSMRRQLQLFESALQESRTDDGDARR